MAAPRAVGLSDAPRTRRGGYWLGLLASAATAVVTMAAMPFISQFKLNGAPIQALIVPGAIAVLNTTVVAAIIFLLSDLALRGLGWRRPWIYGAVCAVATLVFYVGLALLTKAVNPIFTLYVAVWPAVVGGWVMGHYRR
ncbi:hypothetical protein [Brevundimonas sp. GCM10030266]|uniref:hypothetical protein n=1 Tax=Brevundimonas sp. GCM10030266 TaxID=3273386 RepID=UPI0036062A32